MDAEQIRQSYPLTPEEVVAELLALSVAEHTNVPGMRISIELDGATGALTDTGRGMRLTPDPGDTLSHVERALTSLYPVSASDPEVQAVLVDLVWGDRGSLGPALASASCPELEFTSRRQGEAWSQTYQDGVPQGPAELRGPADATGTTIRFETSVAIKVDAVQALAERLRLRIPDLRLEVIS